MTVLISDVSGVIHILVVAFRVKSGGQLEQEVMEVPEHVVQVTSHFPQYEPEP